MKKYNGLHLAKGIAALLLALTLLASCGSGNGGTDTPSDASGQITIVTTVYPAYSWTRSVLGEERLEDPGVQLILLMDNGVDFHSYQPTASDLAAIKSCDMLVYVGGTSEQWIEDALRDDANPDMVVVRMMDSVGDRAVTEEEIEGMTVTEEPEEEEEYDEHVWLSLRNAELITGDIGAALSKIDPDHADIYNENAAALIGEMQAMDAEYEAVLSQAKTRTLVFGDRFPFRYLLDDYGLSYYAAFVGCSAESEASFETIRFLASKVDELGLKYVLAESANGERISCTIIETTQGKDQEILILDDMQSYRVDDGYVPYLDRMRNNLEILKKATA